ncbi:ABC transporter substrate-binding protein [Gordonia rubripertincta]|uniref:ABC transporter substrate-binding protein n=1 Tax=Gordonia rubripertincta TaxID=36822 RepID=UPI000B8DA23E|nr:PhnD/SsuA/transferrin family substrate-binding protein [Gordonia rubripertincta]ASR01695.1 alkanesulfonate transporter substrate-binding subunit [Gordonia rubripertincta]
MSIFRRSRLVRTGAALLSAAALTFVAACGGDNDSSSADGKTTLVWGIQTADFPALFEASGLFEDLPYNLDIPIINGPAQQLQALYSKRTDVGHTGAGTAAIELANAPEDWNATGKPAIQAIAITLDSETKYPAPSLFVRTDKGINSIEDLRGKSIAFNFGGNIYAAYVVALAQAGLTEKDVKPAKFADNQAAAAAFVAGEVDAVVTSFELAHKLLADGSAKYIPGDPALSKITGGGSSITRPDVLADPAKLEAIKDFYGRLHKFYAEWYPNNKEAVTAVYKRVLNQPDERAEIKFEANRQTRFLSLADPEVIANQQIVVTEAFKAGGVKHDRNVAVAYNPILDPITVGTPGPSPQG